MAGSEQTGGNFTVAVIDPFLRDTHTIKPLATRQVRTSGRGNGRMQDSTISERNLLGAALLDGSTWELAAAALPSENFSNDSHRCIHRAMAAVATRGDQISLITVSDELGRRKQLDKIGGTAYLSTLSEGV